MSLHCMNPGANMSSGNGPLLGHDPDDPRATGYRIRVSTERSPRCWPVTPTCAGSASVICRSATPYVPARPGETTRAGAAEAVLLGVPAADGVAAADAARTEGDATERTVAGGAPPQAATSTTAASTTTASSLAAISRRPGMRPEMDTADTTVAS